MMICKIVFWLYISALLITLFREGSLGKIYEDRMKQTRENFMEEKMKNYLLELLMMGLWAYLIWWK